MPTGYTCYIKDGIEFKDFALKCAKAFGACITMRDDPADTPIPDEFKPSDFYLKRIQECEMKIHTLNEMSNLDIEKSCEEDYQRRLRHHREYLCEKEELRTKYLAMRGKVQSWNPPSKDHEGLKKFMLDQINQSIEFDCDVFHISEPKKFSAEEWFAQELEEAKRSLLISQESHQEEVERVNQRNQWIKQLRDSLEES